MRVLSKPEVFTAVQYVKSIDENQGRRILENFAKQQAGMQQMLFGGFPQAIAILNQEMAHLFMDLCFDIICVYQRILGDMPKNIATPQWIHQKMTDLENEIKAQTTSKSSVSEENTQTELLEYLALSVEDFVAGNQNKQEAATAMYNLLFLVTRLFDSVYEETSPTLH